MEEILAYRAELLTNLDGVVDKLAKIVAELPANIWIQPINAARYTPHFILSHLRELELHVFSAQLPRFLAEDTPMLTVFEDEDWISKHYRPEESPLAILEEFCQLRHQELAWLRDLAPAGWSRLARHPWWGLHALQWWVELQVEYSCLHLEQLSALRDI